jgi:predicted dehydrogenase
MATSGGFVDPNRRQFMKDTIRGGATLAAAPLFIPATARGANDRLSFGLIGAGNRGGYLNEAFQGLGAQCVALCDVYQAHLEKARRRCPAGVKTYTNHKELLAHAGLDFVVIATPDHHHAPMLFDALDKGKDVYLEKPLSLTLAQSAEMVGRVRKTRQVVQIGMQRRSMNFIRQAKQLIDDGALGKVSMVKAMWNWHFAMPLDGSPLPAELDWERFLGSAPRRPLDPSRFRWWRGFWDYSGGNMTDQGTHLMDVVQWMTGSGAPRSAVCQGRITNASAVEVPNIFTAVFEYPDFLATWTLNYRNTYQFDWSITFQGEEAAMVLDRRGLQLYSDPGASPEPWSQKVAAAPVKEIRDTDRPEAHQQNFLEAVRARKEPNCPIEIAAAAVTGPHMANVAYRQERRVRLGADGTLS